MADQYDQFDDDDDDVQEQPQIPADLRKQLRRLEKERKSLQEELAALKDASRSRSVKDVLETAGVNPKIAAFIPKDVSTPEQIAAWLGEYGDVFGVNQQTTSQEPPSELVQAQRRMDDSTATAQTPAGDDDVARRIANANSREELDQIVFGMSRGR